MWKSVLSRKRIFRGIGERLGLIVADILNPEIFEDLKEGLSVMSEGYFCRDGVVDIEQCDGISGDACADVLGQSSSAVPTGYSGI